MPGLIDGSRNERLSSRVKQKEKCHGCDQSGSLPVIGGIAGWIAGNVMKGGGFGVAINIVVGIVGAVLGGFVFGLLGVTAGGIIGSLIVATVGAIILLFLAGLIKKA